MDRGRIAGSFARFRGECRLATTEASESTNVAGVVARATSVVALGVFGLPEWASIDDEIGSIVDRLEAQDARD